jgi:hypothetical protein
MFASHKGIEAHSMKRCGQPLRPKKPIDILRPDGMSQQGCNYQFAVFHFRRSTGEPVAQAVDGDAVKLGAGRNALPNFRQRDQMPCFAVAGEYEAPQLQTAFLFGPIRASILA